MLGLAMLGRQLHIAIPCLRMNAQGEFLQILDLKQHNLVQVTAWGDMPQELDAFATALLQQYLNRLGTHLKDHRKRESFAIYALALVPATSRKSSMGNVVAVFSEI